jgi:hypothetical protein
MIHITEIICQNGKSAFTQKYKNKELTVVQM